MDVDAATARAPAAPDLAFEGDLLARGHCLVGGLDEVGRGAWAGPLYVGVVVIDASTGPLPEGTNDSKALSPKAREELRPELASWCTAWSLGIVTAEEIDAHGLTAALRVAARRALAALPVRPDALVVDGPIDFLTPREGETPSLLVADLELEVPEVPEVHPIVAADATCGSVAAASVLAKVARDHYMASLIDEHPGYDFEQNKGYGTRSHRAAVASLGLTSQHRRTWTFASLDAVAAPPVTRRRRVRGAVAGITSGESSSARRRPKRAR